MIGPILTQSSGILRPISIALGWLMNLIYVGMGKIGINNVAVTIIIFTVIIYLALMPLTIKQQKFSKMTQIMNPELQAIQKKYRGKRDQLSAQKMNEETQEVYRKYGVSPSGSCIFLVIQLPILFALYRVIYNVPGYITGVKSTFTDLATQIFNTPGSESKMTGFLESIQTYAMRGISVDYSTAETAQNSIIDILYKCTSSNWDLLKETFSNISTDLINATQATAEQFNNFLGVSIVYSPKNLISTSFHEGHYLLILIAILIPVISAATQFLNIRLMPTAAAGQSNMGGQMKMMNYMMPIYSFILVFFLPVGVGVYWITGAVIRSIQQFLINRHLDKQDLDAIIKKNQEKAKEKQKKRIEKKGVAGSQISEAAKINTRRIDTNSGQVRSDSLKARANSVKSSSQGNSKKNQNKGKNKTNTKGAANVEETIDEQPEVKLKKDSLAAKANMVREFNNKNTRK